MTLRGVERGECIRVHPSVSKNVAPCLQKSVDIAKVFGFLQKSVDGPACAPPCKTPRTVCKSPRTGSPAPPLQKSVDALQKSVDSALQKSMDDLQKSLDSRLQKSVDGLQKSLDSAIAKVRGRPSRPPSPPLDPSHAQTRAPLTGPPAQPRPLSAPLSPARAPPLTAPSQPLSARNPAPSHPMRGVPLSARIDPSQPLSPANPAPPHPLSHTNPAPSQPGNAPLPTPLKPPKKAPKTPLDPPEFYWFRLRRARRASALTGLGPPASGLRPSAGPTGPGLPARGL